MYNWQENYVSYDSLEKGEVYLFCDTNASYASIHQYLEGDVGKPCVVANGNSTTAGSCLAISYEARGLGLMRGSSLVQAKKMCRGLVVYESCLPLYEIYSDLYDMVLEWIVPKSFCYRGSCDEVIIEYEANKFPFRSFQDVIKSGTRYIKEMSGLDVEVRVTKDQMVDILKRSRVIQVIYGVAYLIRDSLKKIIGLPISMGVAPSVSLSKALIDHAKPKIIGGKRIYKTLHDAIFFPQSPEEANKVLRKRPLGDICGVKKVAKRMMENGIYHVSQVQDQCGLDRAIRLAQNKHLGEVLWYSAHGRDDVLPAYLSAIKYRK